MLGGVNCLSMIRSLPLLTCLQAAIVLPKSNPPLIKGLLGPFATHARMALLKVCMLASISVCLTTLLEHITPHIRIQTTRNASTFLTLVLHGLSFGSPLLLFLPVPTYGPTSAPERPTSRLSTQGMYSISICLMVVRERITPTFETNYM